MSGCTGSGISPGNSDMTLYTAEKKIRVRDTKTGEIREAVKRTVVDHNGNVRVPAYIRVLPRRRFVEVD